LKTLLSLTASVLALSVVAAHAQDRTVTSGGTGLSLTLSGQVNRGVLFTDDGQNSDTFFVDNDNSSTRFRILGQADVGETTVGFNIEIEAESNSTASVSQLEPNGPSGRGEFLNERKLELFFANPTFGRLTLGQGDTASNDTSEVDLSGTAVVGYSGIADQAGGVLFTDAGTGALTAIAIGNAFNNLDGLSRRDRIRYDTPNFGGLSLGVSAGTDFYDVAVTYRGTVGAFTIGGALSYSEDADDDDITNGSVSALHNASGLSLTVAGGNRDNGSNLALTEDTSFAYVKAGWQTNGLSPLGKSAFSIDYSQNDDTLSNGDEATSVGVQFVQRLDGVGTDLYVGYRNYDYEAPGSSFDDIDTLLVGARVRF
jgi:hypothetical protein